MQDFENLILAALRAEYRNSTYKEMAKRSGISLSYIHDLVTGAKPINAMSIGKLYELFPDATIILKGEIPMQTIGNNSNGNIQQAGIGLNASADTATLRMALVDAICDLDLSPEDQARVIQAIRKTMQK